MDIRIRICEDEGHEAGNFGLEKESLNSIRNTLDTEAVSQYDYSHEVRQSQMKALFFKRAKKLFVLRFQYFRFRM